MSSCDSRGTKEAATLTSTAVVGGGGRNGEASKSIQKLYPPVNYGAVCASGIHRCGLPIELNNDFIATLELKTVLVLSPSTFPVPAALARYVAFLESMSIRVVCLEGAQDEGKHGDYVSASLVEEALGMMCNPSNLPLMLTCSQGKHLSGIVVGCFRKTQQNWSLVSVFEEYRRFAGPGFMQSHEQFIEAFSYYEKA